MKCEKKKPSNVSIVSRGTGFAKIAVKLARYATTIKMQ